MASIIKADTLQSTTSNVFVLNSAGTEYARFDSTGNFQLANPTTFPAGTAALPSITTAGDTNTGLYFPAADTIGFVEGGAEAMRIDSSGNLGIGTSSPAVKLHVNGGTQKIQSTGSTSDAFLTLQNDVGTQAILGIVSSGNNPANAFYIETNAGKSVVVDSSGNFMVNTTSTAGNASTFKSTAGAAQQAVSFWNNATTGTRYFVTFGTEASYTERGFITWNGTTTALSNASDFRLKENIVNAPSALQKIADIQIRSFDFKEDGRHVEYGVIAQELIEVIPAAVFEGSDNADGSINKAWSVGLEPIIPVLVKALQEQQALIIQLQADVAALKAK